MDRDELKDAIEGTLEHTCCEDFETQATSILSLIAPELEKARILNDKIGHLVATDIAVLVEKARKWDRFVGIQSCNDCPAYPECPCDDTNCPALKIENALSKEAT